MARTITSAVPTLSVALLLAIPAKAASDDGPSIAPWVAVGSFGFQTDEKKTRRSLSGVACAANSLGQRLCPAVFDEGGEARHLVIQAYALDGEAVILRNGAGEFDGEGAATHGGFYYVTGSHSAKRKDCANNPAGCYERFTICTRSATTFSCWPAPTMTTRIPIGSCCAGMVRIPVAPRLYEKPLARLELNAVSIALLRQEAQAGSACGRGCTAGGLPRTGSKLLWGT